MWNGARCGLRCGVEHVVCGMLCNGGVMMLLSIAFI